LPAFLRFTSLIAESAPKQGRYFCRANNRPGARIHFPPDIDDGLIAHSDVGVMSRIPVTHNDRAEAGEAHPGLADGRQSEAALAIRRGTMRMLAAHDFASLTELTLPSWRRADIISVSDKGEIWIVEIKSSLEDFRSDSKWQAYEDYCDRFFFAVDSAFPVDVIPETAGLIIADRFGAEIVRMGPLAKLAAARRKNITHRMAQVAANRLHALEDPEAKLEASRVY
jgi:hypothetical protein